MTKRFIFLISALCCGVALSEGTAEAVATVDDAAVIKRDVVSLERQKFAARLRKVLEISQAWTNSKKLQFQIAAYSAALGNWSVANQAFMRSDNYACAVAARQEMTGARPDKVADAWWIASDSKPDFLPRIIRSHAVDLYRKAIDEQIITGFQKEEAERRIAEFETNVESELYWRLPPEGDECSKVGSAQFVGAKLVGDSVRERNGLLWNFSEGSYAQIQSAFEPNGETIEAVVEFTVKLSMRRAGLLGAIGKKNGFAPFNIHDNQLCGCISSNGTSWDVVPWKRTGLQVHERKTYRVKCTWDGKAYAWFVWDNEWSVWSLLKKIKSSQPVFGGLHLQIGTNRGEDNPFDGVVDLKKCYICIGGKLWWEGVKGAYQNANR